MVLLEACSACVPGKEQASFGRELVALAAFSAQRKYLFG
jgi:hypothetical protein